MAAKSKHRWLPSRRILLLLGFMVKVLHADLVSRCSEQCAVTLTDDSVIDRDISCNQTCKINSCSTGCGLWDNTTLSICNIACNSTFYTQQHKVQYCQSGCVYAEDVYADEIRRLVGDPTAPRISDDEIKATSVSLEWVEAGHPGVTYLVQWRYEGNTAWVTYQLEPAVLPFIVVSGLRPYKTYEFRVQWVITSREILSSPASRSVTTDAEGVPQSPPIITSLLSPSSSTTTVAWQPPQFPSGPLVSYTVSIESADHFPIRLEVPDTVLSHTYVRLKASTLYTVEVEANNMVGASPTAVRSITTLAGLNVTSTVPYLVVGMTGGNLVSEKKESMVSFVDLNQLTGYPDPADVHIVEHENHTIQDVAVHYWKNLVIFSDTTGALHKREIDVNNFQSGFDTTSDIVYQSMGDIIPTVVDIDWLFDHIYFVEEDQILRCDLNCSEIEVVLDNLDTSPTDVKVDPYHGYLYWSEIGAGKGIYRIDLANIGPDSGISPDLVIQADTIRSFVVDSLAYELFYANEESLSLDGAFLDGTGNQVIIPSKGASSDADFVDVNGIVYYNNLFTWTRHAEQMKTCFLGGFEYTEDKMYLNTGGVNFQESFTFACPEAFHGLDVFHPSYQPYPIPPGSPANLQVLFVDTAAELIWIEPQRLDSIGRGVWQDWQYRVELTKLDTGEIMTVEGDATEAIRVTGLNSSMQYSVRVRAFSIGGEGPWSEVFNGTTLQTVDIAPYVVFSGDSDIMRIGLDGNNQDVLNNQAPVKDLDWYGDSIYWVDSSGLIFEANVYDTSNSFQLPVPQNAESLAVDWLGGVLYWGDLKQHKIFRIGLNSEGASTAEIAYLSDAQDLALDAVNAYMYWTTAQSVECARLNGQEYFEYTRKADFSGELIAGLTLDLDGGSVYWFELSFVDGAQQLMLYRADMAGYSNTPASTVEEIGVVNSITEKPALHYYSQKLLWIDENNKVIIIDMKGDNLATLSEEPAHALSVVQESSLHPLPAGHDAPPNVIPSTIPESSVVITGTWDDFSITWDASTEVTYGNVLYEISVIANNALPVNQVLSEPSYRIQNLEPYAELQVSLMSYTYWAYTQSITVMMKSPQSVPTIPLNPRVFILEEKDIMAGNSTYSADIRWETVEKTNGVLLGYKISWGISADSLLQLLEIAPDAVQYTLDGLGAGTTYFFKIEAYTEIGSGPATDVIETSTAAANPPPTLITLTPSGGASQRDTDTGDSVELLGGATVDAVAMVFDSESDQLYWLDADAKLKTSPLYADDIKELADIKPVSDPSPNSLAINWLTRQLYWPEPDGIYMYDAAQETAQKVKVVVINSGSKVIGIGVNPFTSSLLWTEQDQLGNTTIMTSDFTGQNKRPLFGNPVRRRRQACSCTVVNPGPVMVVDLSDANNGMVYFVSGDGSGDLWAADLEGCQCQKVVDAASLTDSGLPPDSLSVDSQRLYWTNTNDDIVASVAKTTGDDFQSQSAGGATFVIAFGNNLQPFPDPACLVPQVYDKTAQLNDIASDGLTLTLDPATSSPECTDISLATPMYTVHYRLANSTGAFMEETTSSTSVALTGLEPYTNYSIEVSVANLYTSGEQPHGPTVVYRTKEGVPSIARNLVIWVLTQSKVNALWTQPVQPNGDPRDLRYRIEYGQSNGDGSKSTTSFANVKEIGNGEFSITIDELLENEEYEFWVQSYPVEGTDYSITADPVVETTYPVPASVQLVGSTDETLEVTWQSPNDMSIMQHSIEYAEGGLVDDGKPEPGSGLMWKGTIEENTLNNTLYEVTIDSLRPYTYYHVRAQVMYQSGLPYVYATGDAIITTYNTAAGPPGQPLPPRVEADNLKITYVTWVAPASNGPGELSFVLQAAKVGVETWDIVYKGMDTTWRFNESVLTVKETYRFRVAAIREGVPGPYSTASDGHFVVAPPTDDGGFDTTIIYAAIAGVVCLLIVIILAIIFVRRSKAKNKRKMESTLQVHFSPDQELATLRNMPQTVVNRDNTLYAVTTTASGAEVELPIFPRERLKLVTFLGSGAFGEVFEGLATDIRGSGTGDARVAVKTLRKGATDEEKDDFLKEAALMGNFQNENILALLGVCLDNDPQFIILELMEGGDLLTYIRGARASSATPARLSPGDLTDIITDVAKGCQYLESIKFVHRDLAARNCLVNTKDYAGPNVDRCVKIGDFGLARDIYKSDYYRKEGEGLLPVRWMSPEALVDGIFSVQSDVWSYGVLMWEVMTLGQQPYPARNNLDVLHFVTAGGRLSRPDNCPDDIHHIMLQCWDQTAGSRPSFRSTVERLESYKRNSIVGGFDNQGYETSAGMNVKYARLQDPNLDEYLLPMDSLQSLHDPRVPGSPQGPPAISVSDPNDDIDRHKAEQTAQGARKKRSDSNAPSRPALDEAVANLPVAREKSLEPRYHAFPPKGSMGKAGGRKYAPPVPDDGPPLDAPGRPASQHGPMIDPEDISSNNNNGALAGATAAGYEDDGPPPALQHRRHPNPFRKNSFDESEKHQYANLPDDGQVTAFANV